MQWYRSVTLAMNVAGGLRVRLRLSACQVIMAVVTSTTPFGHVSVFDFMNEKQICRNMNQKERLRTSSITLGHL